MNTVDGPRAPRGALDGMGYNLALLLGCALPAMLLGVWGVLIGHGQARGVWGEAAGLLFGYFLLAIPLSMFGALFLPVVMYLGGGWPRRARAIAVGGVLLVLAALLATALPLEPLHVASWAVFTAGMVAWALGIRLNRGGRPDEVEWIAALAPGALLVLLGGLYVVALAL